MKYQREPNWDDTVDQHLYSLDPLTSLSVDTLDPLKEDESVNHITIVIVDNFSKLGGLYRPKHDAKEFVRALLQWISIFGVPKEIRTDGGYQFTSQLSSDLCSLLGYLHLVIVVYHKLMDWSRDIIKSS